MMNRQPVRALGCAIYTRVSTEHGLEQEFNSLDSQREASEAYVKSQAHEGWRCLPGRYDDGGFSGGSMERPALQRLLGEIRSRRIDVIVVYKVDRLTRSLTDFAKLVELFDGHGVSFVSVTQAFNTCAQGRHTDPQARGGSHHRPPKARKSRPRLRDTKACVAVFRRVDHGHVRHQAHHILRWVMCSALDRLCDVSTLVPTPFKHEPETL